MKQINMKLKSQKEMERKKERQADRQTYRHQDRQIDRQIDRHTVSHTADETRACPVEGVPVTQPIHGVDDHGMRMTNLPVHLICNMTTIRRNEKRFDL